MPQVAYREPPRFETLLQRGDGGGGPAVDEPGAVRRLDDVRAHDALAPAMEQVDWGRRAQINLQSTINETRHYTRGRPNPRC